MAYDPTYVPPSRDLSGWETTLTDPTHHSPDGFRYLVHAVQLPHTAGQIMQRLFLTQEMIDNPSILYNPIDLMSTPGRIAEKPVISTSLIDQDHRATWRAGGYILRVPLENILKTASGDIGTNFAGGESTRRKLYEKRDVEGIADSATVLARSDRFLYNEIVLAGTGRTGQKVEITGVFIKVLPTGKFVDEELARGLMPIAFSHDWPLIRMEEPYREYSEGQPPTIFSESAGFGFNKDGKRYIFCTKDGKFSVAEYGGVIDHAMSPVERTEGLKYLREYLASNPSTELESLMTEAEKVPDDVLMQRVQREMHHRNAAILGREGMMIDTYFSGSPNIIIKKEDKPR